MVVGLTLDIDVAAAEARIVLVFLHDRRLSVDVITCLLSWSPWSAAVPREGIMSARGSKTDVGCFTTAAAEFRASVKRLKCFSAATRAGTGDCVDF